MRFLPKWYWAGSVDHHNNGIHNVSKRKKGIFTKYVTISQL